MAKQPQSITVNLIGTPAYDQHRKMVIDECIQLLKSERDRRRSWGGTPGPAWTSAIAVLSNAKNSNYSSPLSDATPDSTSNTAEDALAQGRIEGIRESISIVAAFDCLCVDKDPGILWNCQRCDQLDELSTLLASYS